MRIFALRIFCHLLLLLQLQKYQQSAPCVVPAFTPLHLPSYLYPKKLKVVLKLRSTTRRGKMVKCLLVLRRCQSGPGRGGGRRQQRLTLLSAFIMLLPILLLATTSAASATSSEVCSNNNNGDHHCDPDRKSVV